jgi:hypothetical protein
VSFGLGILCGKQAVERPALLARRGGAEFKVSTQCTVLLEYCAQDSIYSMTRRNVVCYTAAKPLLPYSCQVRSVAQHKHVSLTPNSDCRIPDIGSVTGLKKTLSLTLFLLRENHIPTSKTSILLPIAYLRPKAVSLHFPTTLILAPFRRIDESNRDPKKVGLILRTFAPSQTSEI